MENNKKILIPTIIAVVTLILLVFGATYAYFTVGSTNNFGTKNLSATIEGMAEDIILQQVENELSLDVTRVQMSEDNAGTTYYASGSSTPANIAKISTSGDGTFTCTYKINVTKSATNDLYTAFQGMSTKSTNQIYLNINDSKYDFNTASLFPITYNGTISGVSKDTPQYITANLALLNKNVNQNALKGKDITLTFSISDFNCELEKPVPIFAVHYNELDTCLDENDCIYYDVLKFYQNNDEVNVGDTYKGSVVANVYKDLNNTNYTSAPPWSGDYAGVEIVEEIKPQNIRFWFSNVYVSGSFGYDETISLNNINTSNMTDMSYMFYGNYYVGSEFVANLDTSKVTNMSYMFANTALESYDLRHFDVSKVTNMSHMFDNAGGYEYGFNGNFTGWDTSKVTDMSYMFKNTADDGSIMDDCDPEISDSCFVDSVPFVVNGIQNWDTSNVTNMSHMFDHAGYGTSYSLNLSSWNVSKVQNYENFNLGVTRRITAPTWAN